MDDKALSLLLTDTLRSSSIEDPPDTLGEKLLGYCRLIEKWNASINLTATRDLEVFVHRHVEDCLAPVPFLRDCSSLVDIGSGAGLPGLIIALAMPNLHVTSVEPSSKRYAFLQTAKQKLNINNFTPKKSRLENLTTNQFSAAISRATFDISTWLERAETMVHKKDGLILAMEAIPMEKLPHGVIRHPYGLQDRSRAILVKTMNPIV